jgi:hypothetical protein
VGLEVISIHFPKAAGSSLAENLRRHFGDALALDYGHDPVNPNHVLSEPPILPPGIRAVHGHFRGNRYDDYRGAFRFTFLRDPVSNLISIYYFWRSWPPGSNATHDRFVAERPSIVDFARDCWPIRRLMSLTYFGGVDIGAFDFVGFYETRERDLERLSTQIGANFSGGLHVNPTTSAEADERRALVEDARTLATLRSLLADDIAFYESARQRWD